MATLYTTGEKQFATLDSTDSSLIGSGSKYVTGRRGFFRKIIRRIWWSSVFSSRIWLKVSISGRNSAQKCRSNSWCSWLQLIWFNRQRLFRKNNQVISVEVSCFFYQNSTHIIPKFSSHLIFMLKCKQNSAHIIEKFSSHLFLQLLISSRSNLFLCSEFCSHCESNSGGKDRPEGFFLQFDELFD